ncbi:MAG: hypothetical protein ACKO0W_04910 [Planctomycetota bacterium]
MNAPGTGEFGARAHRLLVRVLLALRGEVRRSDNPLADEARVQLLADRIMREIPRRVIPVGLAALVVVGAFCAMPLVRDVIEHGADDQPAAATVASTVERGLRERGRAMSDGFAELRQVVEPLSGSSGAIAEEEALSEEQGPVSLTEVALAPFKKS